MARRSRRSPPPGVFRKRELEPEPTDRSRSLRANLGKVDLSGDGGRPAVLIRANLDATLIGVSLVGADLTGASLWCASLVDTDLTAATLIRANLGKVDLSGDGGRPAVLIRANLVGADLSDANLNGADLRGADLSYVNFTAAYLGSSILTGATMIDTVGCDDSRRLPGCYLNQVTESSTAPE